MSGEQVAELVRITKKTRAGATIWFTEHDNGAGKASLAFTDQDSAATSTMWAWRTPSSLSSVAPRTVRTPKIRTSNPKPPAIGKWQRLPLHSLE
jgi:hypothetical protein